MNTVSFLDSASDLAFANLIAVGGNLNALPKVLKTIVIIYSAQGLIDNGGLEYFFGNDFPNNPPYSKFIDAYREIGATTVANTIEKSLAFFETSQPELNLKSRLRFIESLPSDYSHEFSKLSTSICGDASVWSLLKQYVENHRTEIEQA
jgi:hypothetical protein